MWPRMICVAAALAVLWTAADSKDASEIYNSIPSEERKAFLAYNLALVLDPDSHQDSDPHEMRPIRILDRINITKELRDKYENMDIPEDVPAQLYNWIKKENDLSDSDMIILTTKGIYCKPPCTDLNNPGSNCCF